MTQMPYTILYSLISSGNLEKLKEVKHILWTNDETAYNSNFEALRYQLQSFSDIKPSSNMKLAIALSCQEKQSEITKFLLEYNKIVKADIVHCI